MIELHDIPFSLDAESLMRQLRVRPGTADAAAFAEVLGAVMAVGVWALVAFQGNSNRLGRIDSWLNASCNPDVATCYQFIHGKWALASGGLSGVGLGAGSEKWLYLPEAHNDFIYAVVAEELGLVGAGIVHIAVLRCCPWSPDGNPGRARSRGAAPTSSRRWIWKPLAIISPVGKNFCWKLFLRRFWAPTVSPP